MPHTFMYPRVTQIAPRAHSVRASWLFSGRPARAAGDLLGPRANSLGVSTEPSALRVPARAMS